jgi:hypothetical protein
VRCSGRWLVFFSSSGNIVLYIPLKTAPNMQIQLQHLPITIATYTPEYILHP